MPPPGHDAGATDLTRPRLVCHPTAGREPAPSGCPRLVIERQAGQTTTQKLDAGTYVLLAPSPPVGPASLAWAVSAGAEGIALTGAVGRRDIEQFGARLAVAEAECGRAAGEMRILAVADTPAGVLALPSLVPAARLAALACDPARLAEALGCEPDAPAIVQAKAMTVLAAAVCRVPTLLILPAATESALDAAAREGFGAALAPPESQRSSC